MDMYNKVLLYTAVLRPNISYGCPVWGYAAKTNVKILETAQNSIIRTITKTNRYKGTATAGSDVIQSGRPIFDDFFQHLWPYIGNNTANVVFQMVKRLWLIRIDQ
ncbi:hypothetical protein TNCV_4842632 [Trichonephila clavipes]|uniref:Uncharacterized protein n=1 Tax=Trichonephila clavipes TaxID=2585209 RepID=A0A8X6WJG9_TRICX|nr:hypothetical protein TNCV_4842632 [Trichonephila clavipes]